MNFKGNGLYTLIEESLRDISDLDPNSKETLEAFANQLLDARKDLFEAISSEDVQKTAVSISACMINVIKEIPDVVEAMLNAIDRRTTEPAIRCALAGALAYLVRPRDLLPDSLPGGFGFVDDCMILRATITEFLNVLPKDFTSAEREKRLLELLAVCIPPERLPEFQTEVEGIWLTFHLCLWEAEEDVDILTESLLNDPINTPLPQPVRESLPLPAGPRLSMAPGDETIEVNEGIISILFSKGGSVHINEKGQITAWE